MNKQKNTLKFLIAKNSLESMMTEFKTEQEHFWAGEFGNEYIERNTLDGLPSRIALFSKILARTHGVSSILELGANIGINLHAIKTLLPKATIDAVEINEKAFEILSANDWINAHHSSLIDTKFDNVADFVFTSGVLIHIDPASLDQVYENMYNASKKYILVCEYYNPSPVEISYRGNSEKLFKRDFAGEIMSKYPSLVLVDYGFIYKNDKNFGGDDLTWFLLDKNEA